MSHSCFTRPYRGPASDLQRVPPGPSHFFVARVWIRRQPVSVELRHLRYFVAVAEELSFRKAAKRLHIAQPPLGRQIRDLEEGFGTRLFDRSRNPVRLTGAGQVSRAGARETLEAAA